MSVCPYLCSRLTHKRNGMCSWNIWSCMSIWLWLAMHKHRHCVLLVSTSVQKFLNQTFAFVNICAKVLDPLSVLTPSRHHQEQWYVVLKDLELHVYVALADDELCSSIVSVLHRWITGIGSSATSVRIPSAAIHPQTLCNETTSEFSKSFQRDVVSIFVKFLVQPWYAN